MRILISPVNFNARFGLQIDDALNFSSTQRNSIKLSDSFDKLGDPIFILEKNRQAEVER